MRNGYRRGLDLAVRTKYAIAASESHLRPILMTSLSFVLGLVPMMLSSGAGAVSRQSLGTAVTGGMILSTLLSLFIVPVLYILISTAHEHLNKQMSKRLGKRSSIEEPLP